MHRRHGASPARVLKTRELAVSLSVFFSLHDRTRLDAVDRIAHGFVYRRRSLEDALVRNYGHDLWSVCAHDDSTREQRDELHSLAVRLCLFFSIFGPEMLANVGLIARSFVFNQDALNKALTLRYGCDVRC